MQVPHAHVCSSIRGSYKVDKKDFSFRIKSLTDEGTFTGLAAVYNNVDLGGDRILPGAFTRTLSPGKRFVVLWQHDPSNPIGTCTITDTRDGIQVTGALELSDPTAKKAYTFMKSRVVKGLSIGYDTVQASYDGDVRNLTELRLWEVSCVTFPMNEAAGVTAVKAITDDDRAKHLKAIDTHRKAIDRHQRGIREHLKAMLVDGIDDDTAVDAALIDNDEDEETTKALLTEIQMMVRQAQGLA